MFLLNSLNRLVHYGVILVQEVILLAGLPSLGGVSFVPRYRQNLFFGASIDSIILRLTGILLVCMM